MEMEHIPQGTLERFIKGKATRREGQEVVMHLLQGCEACRALASEVCRPAISENAYDEAFDRVARPFVAQWGSIRLPVLRGASACSPW
jgi:predicted anti-sigma-YlaC factor YlaD